MRANFSFLFEPLVWGFVLCLVAFAIGVVGAHFIFGLGLDYTG